MEKNHFDSEERSFIDPRDYSFSYVDGIVCKYSGSGYHFEVPLDGATDEFLIEALSYFHHTDFDPYQKPYKSVREHFLDYCSRW